MSTLHRLLNNSATFSVFDVTRNFLHGLLGVLAKVDFPSFITSYLLNMLSNHTSQCIVYSILSITSVLGVASKHRVEITDTFQRQEETSIEISIDSQIGSSEETN